MQSITSFLRSDNGIADSKVRRNLEIYGIAIVLVTFLILELNAVYKGGAQGQDFDYHRQLTLEVAQHPLSPSPGYHVDPPLYYGVAAVVLQLFGPNWTRAIGVVNVLFNVCALILLYANATLMIKDQFLRLGLLCLVAFLPAFTITSAVICPDALTPIWILAGLYSAGRVLCCNRGYALTLIVCTAMAALSILSKFTAISLIPIFPLSTALFIWCRVISLRQAIVSSLIFLGVTGGLELFLLLQDRHSIASQLTVPHRTLPLRNVLFFRSADVELLRAPSHWNLLPSFAHQYRYSYPALLCLGTFTDVLDFFQDKTGTQPYLFGALVGKRSSFHHRLMEIALAGGGVWFAAMLISLPIFVARSLINVVSRKSRNDLFYTVVALTASAWLGFIVSLLLLVVGAYTAGYWLPRLITPAIVLFLLLFFAGLDRIRSSRLVSCCVSGLAIVQSAIHIQFLWM
jgi:hypothetical protein